MHKFLFIMTKGFEKAGGAVRAMQFASIMAGQGHHVEVFLIERTLEMPDFDDPAGFLAALRAGRVIGHHWDRPRPWTPRIVPSTTGS